jgi:hypothetical protein
LSVSGSRARPTLDYAACIHYYITASQILYCNYPTSKMCCPIMSVIFGKALYLIPIKMPPKRYGKLRGHYAYIRLRDYQTAIYPIIRPPFLEKRKRQLKKKPSTAFY